MEVIREVEKEVIREIKVEVPVEVIREVPKVIEKEVVKMIEVIKEVPIETIRIVEKIVPQAARLGAHDTRRRPCVTTAPHAPAHGSGRSYALRSAA